MDILSLCSGVGTLELGIRIAVPTARTVCYVEREAYACAILAQRMQEGNLDKAPIWTDAATFDGTAWRGIVDCITAGYPCQPFSHAGKQLGEKDSRYIWGDIRRIVAEVNPEILFFENVAGHLRLGFESVYNDLSAMDYRVKAGLFSADEVGAPQKRERLFIMAHAVGKQADGRGSIAQHILKTAARQTTANAARPSPAHVEYAAKRLSQPVEKGSGKRKQTLSLGKSSSDSLFPPRCDDAERWREIPETLKPEILRVADGNAHWVDRNRAVGNAVVPLVAAYAFRTLLNRFG